MSTPADTFTDRTGATDEEFQARVAVFDAAEEPEEITAAKAAAQIPYMMANTPEEFDRVLRRVPWLEEYHPDACGHTAAEGCNGHGDF